MASKYWIKLYHEIVDDPKMGQLPDHLWRRCIELFLIAGEYDQSGKLPNLNDTAWRLRTNAEMLEAELNDLAKLGITNMVDGYWGVTKFRERQGKPYSMKPDAIRQRNYRAGLKKEEEKKEDIDTDMSRDMSRDIVSQPTIHSGSHYELPPEDVPHYQHNEEQRVIVSALSSIVKQAVDIYDPDTNRDADTLLAEGATENKVVYFGSWWKINGHYPGRPAIKSVLQHWKQAMDEMENESAVVGMTTAQINRSPQG